MTIAKIIINLLAAWAGYWIGDTMGYVLCVLNLLSAGMYLQEAFS